MSTPEFTKAWSELNQIQLRAAEWGEGPIVVLAGPGSGKTRVLTCRIARLLDASREKNFRILGLTFTTNAADEMRSRVASYVPGQENRLFLGTFHSFCAELLRQHGQHVNVNPDFNIYSRDEDLREILSKAVAEARKTSGEAMSHDSEALPIIRGLKSRLIPPERCHEAFGDAATAERISGTYRAYEAQLAKRNALDFESLILKAYQLLTEFPAFARRYRTVYPFICIDEFQDTNFAQSTLIRALTGKEHKNILVVADDDQIIYQWNGASHKRIDEFIEWYGSSLVQLPTNYRCPPDIVKLANNLIQHNFMRQPHKEPLQALRPRTDSSPVRFMEPFPDVDVEMRAVARDIGALHSSQLGSVAVLARSRRLLSLAESALHHEGIAAVISQRKNEFESTPLVWLHSVLRLANDRQNRTHLEALCGTSAQLTRLMVEPEEIVTQAQASGLGFLQHWLQEVRRQEPSSLILEAVDEIHQRLVGGRDFRRFSSFTLKWIDRIEESWVDTTGDPSAEVFAGYREERSVWLESMGEITQSWGDETTLEAFLQEMEMHSKEAPPRPDTVVLMTIHGAKGKEFDHVYLIGMMEDELPSFQSKRSGDRSLEMEEERRNCFVAITRTIETLTMTYSRSYRGWAKEPSRFIGEMGDLPPRKPILVES